MFIIAWLVLFVVLAAIILMIAAGIDLALRDKNEERVQRLADARFKDMLAHAEFRVIQRLEIIDEMRRDK